MNDWIPVEKQLPPDDGRLVLVTAENRRGERNVYFACTAENWFPVRSKVVAWMPMPEPFEGDSNE